MSGKYIPPRLAVLLAAKCTKSIIVCRHTSKRTVIIGWDRKNDTFMVGQWLKGKVYPYRSDVSPDGSHWIYFAMDARNNTYTCVARTPYLKAVDFYTKGDAWNGGGLFLSDKAYWLNDGGLSHKEQRRESGLSMERTDPFENYEECQTGEDPFIYFRRLEREGWLRRKHVKGDRFNEEYTFTKRINRRYHLIKIFHAGLNHPIGRGAYYETYQIYDEKSKETVEYPEWEWAEVDNNRVIWAEGGKLFAAENNKLLKEKTELFDAAKLQFELLEAPY